VTAVKIPGQYAKFITVLLGQALLYCQTFGWEWNIKPAATMAAVALAVLAVPNTPKRPAEVGWVGPRMPAPAAPVPAPGTAPPAV
jgi:hypothetical protein